LSLTFNLNLPMESKKIPARLDDPPENNDL